MEAFLAGRPVVVSPHVRLDLPASFEQGSTVPLSITVDSPMTAADHVRRVAVFAQGNPFPEVASFDLTPDSGRADVATRIRLNEGKREVVAVAELSDGRVWLGRRTIEIGIGGCGAETGVVINEAMPPPVPRIKVPTAVGHGEVVEIRTMISHWMETGLRSDGVGNPIPRNIIHRMVCERDGRPIFAADLSPAIAANSYLTFAVLARNAATLTFTWYEDGGSVYRASRSLMVV